MRHLMAVWALARFRPAVTRPFESDRNDLPAGSFDDPGSNRQSAFPAEVAARFALIGLEAINAGCDSFTSGPGKGYGWSGVLQK